MSMALSLYVVKSLNYLASAQRPAKADLRRGYAYDMVFANMKNVGVRLAFVNKQRSEKTQRHSSSSQPALAAPSYPSIKQKNEIHNAGNLRATFMVAITPNALDIK